MSHPDSGESTGKRLEHASFPRSHRLTKESEFKRVFRKPLVISDPFFKILARTNEEPHPRLGFAVSRQVDRRSAGRNRIKRVIRESFRQWDSGRHLPVDIVVLPRRESASICNSRLRDSLERHWSRLAKRIEG